MSDSDTDDRPRRWPAFLLLAVALVWIGVAAALTVAGAQDYARFDTAPWRESAVILGSFILQLLPPLAVAVFAMAMIARQRPASVASIELVEHRHRVAEAATAAVAHDLDAVDKMLDRIASRVAGLREAAADQGGGLSASAGELDLAATRLVESATRARDAGVTLTAALPETQARAQGLAALLDASSRETQRQLGEVETMLAGLWAAADDASARHNAAIAAAGERLTALATLSDSTAAHVGEQGAALQAVATEALTATSGALDVTRAGVDAQTASLLASVDQARVALDHIGGEAMRTMQKRLDRLLEAADALGQSLSEQDARSKMFIETVERSFTVLDAKLGNAISSGNGALDTLQGRMEVVRDTVHKLGEPIAGTADSVSELELAMARLETATGVTIGSLNAELPASHDSVKALALSVGEVRDNLGALLPPVDLTDATVKRIAAQLDAAKAIAAEVETATGTAAVTATTQLIEVLGRVREVADATAGSMRTALQAVVAEAEEALAETGTATARTAFGSPIRAELDKVGEATERAAAATQALVERVTARLLGLVETVAKVEARIDEVDTAYDVKLRDDLARRSEDLVTALNAAAIDITELLQFEVGQDAWAAYLKGDRGIFARAAAKQVEGGAARKVARHFQHDPAFHGQAVRFITDFEALIERVQTDRQGKALEMALLTSDLGKLYVVMSEAAHTRV